MAELASFDGLTCQDEAVEKVVEFMGLYSISMEDFDTIMELLKYKVLTLISHLFVVEVFLS